MGWALHLHLLAAISWIGGSIFMFVLGISLRDKQKQKEVYPHLGPIFGYFEVVALIVLLATGSYMIVENGLIFQLSGDSDSEVLDSLRKKLWLVGVLLMLTVIHFVIALKTNTKERTPLQNLFSRGSSLLIFLLNLWVLHYAMVIRDIL
ncbi:MAG TPA: hypothetical protein CFH81_02620 [Sulfurovum sp. UBA12169]|nr:MAG TPA: hypothetical protein CFH81_02620 [Sulfurovum sp. UBA12169]